MIPFQIGRNILLAILCSIVMASSITYAETWPDEIMSQMWIPDGAKITRLTRYDEKYIIYYDINECFPADTVMNKLVRDRQAKNWKRLKYSFLTPGSLNNFTRLLPEWGISFGEYWGDKPTDLAWWWHETWEDVSGNIVDITFNYLEPLKNHPVTDPWLHPKPLACNLHVNEHYVPLLVRRNIEKKKWPDTLMPAVISTEPANKAIHVTPNREIKVTFNKPIDLKTLKPTTLSLYVNGKSIPGTLSLDGTVVFLKPVDLLAYDTVYSGVVTSAIHDNAGNPLVSSASWTFETIKNYIWNYGKDAASFSINKAHEKTDLPVVADLTELLKQPFTDVYGAEKFPDIGYRDIQFSPKGRYVALSILGITSGDAEQVWMIDLLLNKVRLLTEPVIKDKVSLTIGKMYWESEETLAFKALSQNLTDTGNQSAVLLRANMSDSQEEPIASFYDPMFTEKIYPSSTHNFEVREEEKPVKIGTKKTTRLFNVKHGDKMLLQVNGGWENLQWTGDDKYFVFLVEHGHGSFSVKGGATKPPIKLFDIYSDYQVYRGFAVSPTKHEIAYVLNDWKDKARKAKIVIYDLQTRSVVRELPVGSEAGVIAWGMNDRFAFSAKTCGTLTEEQTQQAVPQTGLRKICLFLM